MADERRRCNALLRAARERLPSARVPGESLSRAELAERVNGWLWEHTGSRYPLDDHAVARWERGRVRRPVAPYRAALRAVLGAATDAELGFDSCARSGGAAPTDGGPVRFAWSSVRAVTAAQDAAEDELITRRDAVRGAAAARGAALLTPLAAWLEPLDPEAFSSRRGAFSVDEVAALENVVATFRGWRSPGSGLGRLAVVGQLSDVAARLDGAPADGLTDRVFLAAAELAKIAGSMAFDEGSAALAQRHFVTALQMSKAGRHTSFGAVVVAALARQSFDLGQTADGVELVALAQRGSAHAASPGLRAMLATREAWGHALGGHVYGFQRAVDAAETAHAAMDATREPRWLQGLDRAELAGVIGARYRDLARHDHRQAQRAIVYIECALEWRDGRRARNRAFDLVSLARVHLLTGEPGAAVETVRRSLPLFDRRRPGRLARKLAEWCQEAEPFTSVPDVRAARADVADLIAV